jgi:murein DD-endopeptidase MepM/ murein hydrolase activator NlpD
MYFVLFSIVSVPMVAEASLLSFLGLGTNARAEEVLPVHNSQTIPLADAHSGVITQTTATEDQTTLSVTDNMAIAPETGPLGTASDVVDMPESGDINIYVVRGGDTVPAIAKMFGVSEETIYNANDLTKGQKLKVGETLLILPTTGLLHTVKKGDTLSSIAKKYKVSVDDLILSNEVSSDADLVPGDELVIPDGKIDAPKVSVTKKSTASSSKGPVNTSTPKLIDGYWGRPLAGGHFVRGKHGSICRNGVDISDKLGTPVYAAGPGVVSISKMGGYNGGAGNYVVISHTDIGARSIYAHLQKATAIVGSTVNKGDLVGYLGSTGHSTGPHLHFEVCGAANPLVVNPSFGL